MKRLVMLTSAVLVLAGLTACGEKPQTIGDNKNHVAPFQGAQNRFVAPGWTPTDQKSWEQGLKTRLQNTQNEYSRI